MIHRIFKTAKQAVVNRKPELPVNEGQPAVEVCESMAKTTELVQKARCLMCRVDFLESHADGSG